MSDVVIIGSGHAGGQCAAALRSSKFEGSITIIGEETHPPYQRPPLSKGFLSGEVGIERVYLKKDDFYNKNNITLKLNNRVNLIDKDKKIVFFGDNQELPYKNLILATGSRVRKLDVPGSSLDNVGYLRNIEDVENLKDILSKKSKVVIVGAGYIGLEVASVCAQMESDVTVIEMADRVMNRTVDPIISDYYHKLHQSYGVKILLNTALQSFTGSKSVEKVICSEGADLEANVVIIGAGIIPNTELAESAGIECDNGILVDKYCATSISNIYACGDCTNHPNELLNTRLRLESVHNALEQAKTTANSIIGEKIAYNQVPWFWSDQYDHKLQIVGLSGSHHEVVTRESEKNTSFTIFYLRDNELIACDAVNNPKEFLICKKLVANKVKISSDKLKDPTLDLNNLL